MTTISTLGAGNIGTNVARAAIAAGYDVVLSNSRGTASLAPLIEQLGPQARAASPVEAAAAGDLVLVAVPLGRIHQLPLAQLSGKVVMDANNYYPQRDGRIAAVDNHQSTTSELLQDLIPDAHVVKVFNNIPALQIASDGAPAGSAQRRALPIAGASAEAKAKVTAFLDALGFDAVDLGPLSESWRVERDTPAYGKRTTAAELTEIAASTERVVQG